MHKKEYNINCPNNVLCVSTSPCLILSIYIIITAGIIDLQKVRANDTISISELKEIGLRIKTSEKKLQNIKVCSEVWLEKTNNPKDPCSLWQQTPIYVKSTMWSDGQPESKIRVDVQKQVLEGWITNTEQGPYSESVFSNSFDGNRGRSINKAHGILGKAIPLNKGIISNQKPQDLNDRWSFRYTGREFTTNFFRLNSQGTLLSDLLILSDDPNSKVMTCFEFTWENLKGAECIKISSREIKGHNWNERWWLDSARGFALMRYEHTVVLGDKTEAFKKLIEIQELREINEGVWWPIRATCITEPPHSGGDYMRMVYHASEVVANDPNFDNSIFTFDFPKGYEVDDKVTGKTYVVDDVNVNSK